ncbi:MAG: HAMP domain-containing protein [Deltaproteobacteria bacterium]|nr:HAMP domain-containing protein [Deltaproteobacteria bacterium]
MSRPTSTLARQLLALLLLFSFVPLVISNLWGYARSRQFWTEAVLRDVHHVAGMAAADVRRSINDKLREAQAVAHALDGPDDLATIPGADSTATLWELVDTGGRSRALVDRGRTAADVLPHALCAAAVSEAPGPVGVLMNDTEPEMVVSVPALRDADGAARLCVSFPFERHHPLIAMQTELAPFGVMYLVDARRQVIWSSADELEPTRSARTLGDADDRDWTSGFMAEYALPSGTEAVAAYAPAGIGGWGVLVEVPLTAALAGLERLKWQAVTFGALLAVLLTVAMVLTAARLARHLRRVAAAATRVAAGSLGESVPQSGPAEVVELATAFNRMSVALVDSYGRLEERIAARTRELQQSQDFTNLLLDSIDQRVVVVGQDGQISKANRAALTAYGADLVGRRYDAAVEEQAPLSPDHPILETLASGKPMTVERPRRSAHGPEILQVETYPVSRAAGRIESVVEIARVITAEKQGQATLVHHERMAAFGLLAAGVAHEIGNPLAAIQSQLKLAGEVTDPQRIRQTLDVVEKEVVRMSALLRDLVDFTRRRRDELARVSVNDVVTDVVRLLSHDPRARRVQIRKQLAPDLPGVRAKEDRVVQVLLNLGINALDAMPDGGELGFETAAERGAVVVRVTDSGGGIPQALQSRLFEPFFTTKGPKRGTGLGLFVSRAIVEGELAGRLQLEASSDEGTVFVVRLPGVAALGAEKEVMS